MLLEGHADGGPTSITGRRRALRSEDARAYDSTPSRSHVGAGVPPPAHERHSDPSASVALDRERRHVAKRRASSRSRAAGFFIDDRVATC
jgi:hypothetical protein